MNAWNTKDSIELIGIGTVVCSLIFVGIEVRQNSTVARLEAHQAFTELFSEADRELSSNIELLQDLGEVFQGADSNDFSFAQRLRLVSFYRSNVTKWYGLFQAVQEGVLPESYLDLIGNDFFGTEFFRESWLPMRSSFGSDFVEYFETLNWNKES